MKKKRLFRDLSFVILGTLLIFGIVTVVNMFGKTAEKRSQDNVSATRKLADLSVKKQDWRSAVANNTRLVEEDPFNGHARFYAATSRFRVAFDSMRMWEEIQEDENATAEQQLAAKTEFESLAQEAMEGFEQCMDFARYRNRSRANIAMLHMYLGDDELAIDFLAKAINDGFYNKQYRLRSFWKLRGHPRYMALSEQEQRNRSGDFPPIKPVSFGPGRAD